MSSISTTLDLFYIIPYSALGVVFALMLYKTDNIFVSMGFHFMHNGILMAIQLMLTAEYVFTVLMKTTQVLILQQIKTPWQILNY